MTQANRIAFQTFLNTKGAALKVDGAVGPKTTATMMNLFANRNASRVTSADIDRIATALGATSKQVRAVSAVESAGGGYLTTGHPKILWERHWFHRRLRQIIPATGVAGHFVAHPNPGGYTLDADRDGINDSWEKLADGCRSDPVAAFESCSWGKFQIMGGHWKSLGYRSVFDFAWSMREGELGHYTALMKFIQTNNLTGPLRRLSTNAATNEAFARGYNGPAFKKNEYHNKLADEMRKP
jgi:hypothetical protein